MNSTRFYEAHRHNRFAKFIQSLIHSTMMEMENYTEEWPQRDSLARTVIKEIYGDYFSDDDIGRLLGQKGAEVTDKKTAKKIHVREAVMVAKVLLHGFTRKKVQRRTEEILEPLDDEEKQAVRIAIGIEHGKSPTKSETAARLKISPAVLEQLLESAAEKINPAEPPSSSHA